MQLFMMKQLFHFYVTAIYSPQIISHSLPVSFTLSFNANQEKMSNKKKHNSTLRKHVIR